MPLAPACSEGCAACRASLGAVLSSYALLASAAVILWRGGVVWRDTFSPLKGTRKGIV